MNPSAGSGIFGWIITGMVAALLVLLVGFYIPGLYPQKAMQTKI
jgi:hypothetical protein